MAKQVTIVVLALSLLVGAVHAKNIGKYGETYPIKETDMLELIYSRLTHLQQTGELEKINKKMVSNTKKRLDRPEPAGLPTTKSYRQWLVDPSIKISKDILDHKGRIIAPAGTIINPLAYATISSTFLFYDGDIKVQVNWVMEQLRKLNQEAKKGKKVKLVLVNGSISEQGKLFNRRIYFDQKGILTTKFAIKHVPAILTQSGMKIKVEEVVP